MILTDHVSHRAWPPPTEPWVMHQAWNDFLFQHWPVPVDAIRSVVPELLELDLADGVAWLGIIPFHMTDVRPRGTVNVPGVSAFPELNVRTYVKVGDRGGVFFLSLEATSRLAVEAARLTYELPYFLADIRWSREADETIRYHSVRTDSRGPAAALDGWYRPVGDYRYAKRGSLEHWLTERYCLYTADAHGVSVAHVHHLPWPLRDAEVDFPVNTMAAAHGLVLPSTPALVAYSPGVDTVVWRSRRVDTAGR